MKLTNMKIPFTCREIRNGIARLSQLEQYGTGGILMRAGNLRLGDQMDLSESEIHSAKIQQSILAAIMAGIEPLNP